MMTLPNTPLAVIRRLNAAGFAAYAVGGCVRDALLGLTPTDWDITTDALPQETKQVFADCPVIETGIRHGTVTVLLDRQPIEITTYRVDGGYADSRHPDAVTFTPSLLEDLKRRDFTVNAMVWHPDSGIADYFDGKTDLENGCIRCVGEPTRRFAEDALRILRAMRFSATYGFRPEPETAAAMHALAENLRNISAERIRTELFKLLVGKNAVPVLSEFSDILAVCLPTVFPLSAKMATALSDTPQDLYCRLAVLLRDTDAPSSVLQSLKTDNATVRRVERLVGGFSFPLDGTPPVLRRALRQFGEEDLRRVLILRNLPAEPLDALLATDPCYTVGQLKIDGNTLKACGLQGAAIGDTLERLLQAVMDESCENTPDALLEAVKRLS